jgi:tetratricopeptide (TPR) repeat protein
VVLAYWGSLSAPFQFDDEPAVVYNRTLHSWVTALQPPADGAGVTGRPVVNLTFAANYALGGLNPWGYHAVNIAIHAAAALLLAGVLRRTFDRFPLVDRPQALAWAVAAVWALHPLQTESVANVVQRAESLVGLCYLATLYAFIRGAHEAEQPETGNRKPERKGRLWLGFSVVACFLGMASKEVMVSAPLAVLAYDRVFVAGSFAAAWRQRWRYYLALAATWILLAWLVLGTSGRGGSAGFAAGMSPWHYLLTQCEAIVHYVRLVFWPHPLVLDYGTPLVGSLADVAWQAAILVAAGWAAWAWVRRPALGFLGLSFFALLAPSSSFVPVVTQTMAEHRMYLALAVVVVLVALGLQRRLGGMRTVYVLAAATVALAIGTMARTHDYKDKVGLWTQTAAAAPDNPRARLNLGQALFQAGQLAEAEREFAEAVRLKPDYAEGHYNLGLAMARRGAVGEAIGHYERALALAGDYTVVRNDLGIAYAETGRLAEARQQFETALAERPDFVAAHFNLGNLLMKQRRPAEAVPHYEAAATQSPDVAEYQASLGRALMMVNRGPEGLARFEAAVALAPMSAELRFNLGLALAANGRLPEAIAALEETLRLRPDFEPARQFLAQMQADLRRR